MTRVRLLEDIAEQGGMTSGAGRREAVSGLMQWRDPTRPCKPSLPGRREDGRTAFQDEWQGPRGRMCRWGTVRK